MSFGNVPNGTLVYADCVQENLGSVEGLLTCLTTRVFEQDARDQEMIARNTQLTRNLYVVICASLVFFMQAGFAMVCAGAVRRKNLQNTLLKNLLDACGASMAFYAVGYAFAFGDGPNPNVFIGTQGFFLSGVDDLANWLFQYAFSAASATIVAGTLAERCQMSAVRTLYMD
jgi:ammonia channel protein AmtB